MVGAPTRVLRVQRPTVQLIGWVARRQSKPPNGSAASVRRRALRRRLKANSSSVARWLSPSSLHARRTPGAPHAVSFHSNKFRHRVCVPFAVSVDIPLGYRPSFCAAVPRHSTVVQPVAVSAPKYPIPLWRSQLGLSSAALALVVLAGVAGGRWPIVRRRRRRHRSG